MGHPVHIVVVPPSQNALGWGGRGAEHPVAPGITQPLGQVPPHCHPLLSSSSSAGGERPRRRFPGAEAAAIGSGGGDNDIDFGVSIVCMCGVCVRTCQLQHVAEQHVRHNHAYFYFWQGSCQTFFLAAKTTFGSWHEGTRGIYTEFNIFGSEKRLWHNSAKNKSWHDLCQK